MQDASESEFREYVELRVPLKDVAYFLAFLQLQFHHPELKRFRPPDGEPSYICFHEVGNPPWVDGHLLWVSCLFASRIFLAITFAVVANLVVVTET